MSLKTNLRTSLTWGLGFAAAFSAIAAAVAFVGLARAQGSFGEAVSALAIIVLAYLSAALIAGLLVGLLLPIGRSAGGAMALEFLGGLAVYGTVAAVITPVAEWWPKLPAAAVVCGLLVGVPIGWLWWRDERR